MRVVSKINLAVLGLLAASALLVGGFFVSAFNDLRDETFRWFDASARNLATAIGNQAREAIGYFDYAAIETALKKRRADDPDLLYAAVSFGKGLAEKREAGSAQAGPHRAFEVEVREGPGVAARVRIHYATAVLEGKLRSLLWRLGIGAGLTLLLLLGVLYGLVVRLVNRPLRSLVGYAQTAAAGDLTAAVDIRSGDEFGTLARTLNGTTASLRAMVEKTRAAFRDLETVSTDIGAVSHRIAEGSAGQTDAVTTVSTSIEEMNASIKSVVQSVEHLYALAGESSSSMLEMSASVEQVAGNAEGLSAAVEQASASIAEMTASIRSVAEHVGRLADLVASTTSAITEIDAVVREVERNAAQGHELSREVARTMGEDGLAALQRTADVMHGIRTSVEAAGGVIRSLEQRSREIGGILGVINEVNDQTNLLALNAAILAAQAGEHGRGFAVVAEEIRELSARTATSTKEVARIIASVQQESTKAVAAMEDGTRRVEAGVRTVEELGAALRRAAEDSEKSSAASRVIAQATAEQYKGIRQITAASQTLTEMARELARATSEQSTGSAQIVKAADEVRDLANQVKKAMTEQARGIRLTSRASEESARLSQQVLEATREEARGSDLVVRSVASILEITNANAEGVRKLDRMVQILAGQAELLKAEIGRFRIDGRAS